MLYLDVTSASASPMNTGVQRVTRAIFAHLHRRTAVTPILWNRQWKSYCRLSAREFDYLHRPFQRHPGAVAMPDRLANPFVWSRPLRNLRQWSRRVSLKKLGRNGDILLLPEIFQDSRTAELVVVQESFRGRVVAIFHDAAPLRLPGTAGPKEHYTFPRYLRALGALGKVICVSQEAETDLRFFWQHYGLAGTKTVVLGWPLDFGRERQIAAPNFSSRRILSVASLHPRKNHLGLLAAAERIWKEGVRFELVLIGRATTHWGPTVQAAVKRLAEGGYPVRWLGHVTDEALHRAYAECSFTVYPSLREGFGLPILESLWHCRPCVCGGEGAIGEAARDGGCLTVDPADAGSLASAMRELLTSEPTYRRLCAEACARSFRSWDEYAHDLLQELGIA